MEKGDPPKHSRESAFLPCWSAGKHAADCHMHECMWSAIDAPGDRTYYAPRLWGFLCERTPEPETFFTK